MIKNVSLKLLLLMILCCDICLILSHLSRKALDSRTKKNLELNDMNDFPICTFRVQFWVFRRL